MNLQDFITIINNFDSDDIAKLAALVHSHEDIIMIGNGGSNSICSHISQDYTKQLGKRAFTFSDPSRLTCYINDYGRDAAYEQFLKEFSTSNTLVILISSSGNSENIYRCANFCAASNLDFVILTGFDYNNRMNESFRELAKLSVWIDSRDYGIVECAHQVFLHAIVGD